LSRYLAIDIDPQGLFVVAGTARGGVVRVDHALAWVPGTDHGPPPLTGETATAIGEQLGAKLKAAGIAAAPVLVGIGREKVILKELRYPPVAPADEPALIRFQTMKEITENADEVVLDYAPMTPADPSPDGDKRAMAVVVRKDYFAAIQTMCTAAGLKLVAITPRPFAVAAGLVRAFATGAAQPPESPTDAAVVLTLGPQGGEFTAVRMGQMVYTKSVQAPYLANEVLLLGEVRRSLATYSGQNPGQPIKTVYIPEAEEAVGGWGDRLRLGLTVSVRTFDPLNGAAATVPAEQRGRFACAAFLLAGKAADGLPINFAAPRQPSTEADPQRKKLIMAGVLAAVILLAGAVFGYMAVAAEDQKLEALQVEKADLDKTLADLDPDRALLEAADKWASREINYLDELFELTNRLPKDDQVRVRSFKGDAILPDRDGKQPAHAKLDIKIGAKNGVAASSVVTAIERANTGKTKYYVGTLPRTAPPDANSAFKDQFQIETRVNHRPPSEYTESPPFKPLPRRIVAPPPAPTEEDEVIDNP
jgi:hypothetical protein